VGRAGGGAAEAIRTRFRGCTVLTIAHRINTTIDSDMVLVLESGRVVEYDTPANLLEKVDGGVFRGMVQASGLLAQADA
jgi:ABC-type multidrug transport system fused ATPase/permease subunit